MTETKPFYRAHIFVCTNRREEGKQCCAASSGEALRDYMKTRAKELKLADVRVNTAGCLGRCANGPVMVVYPEGVWYSPKSEADVEEILTSHIQQGKVVDRLTIRQ